jgi:hypothetical protein
LGEARPRRASRRRSIHAAVRRALSGPVALLRCSLNSLSRAHGARQTVQAESKLDARAFAQASAGVRPWTYFVRLVFFAFFRLVFFAGRGCFGLAFFAATFFGGAAFAAENS